jgi:putative phosphoribosyl transferase
VFRDRADAGRRLAERLAAHKGEHPVVLALPRGGVAVGFEVAKALAAPLDLLMVRKIGAPTQPELAAAAIVDGDRPTIVVNRDVVEGLAIPSTYIEAEAGRQLAEIARRRSLYLPGRLAVPLAGRTVIVVDDGIATGATTRAALRAARHAQPKRLILAAPVAPPDVAADLAAECDEVVCLAEPSFFGGISLFYDDFHQLEDGEVIALLDEARAFAEPPAEPQADAGAGYQRRRAEWLD